MGLCRKLAVPLPVCMVLSRWTLVALRLWSNSCSSADARREGSGGALLLMVLGRASAAGSSSSACPTSSPAEIMEQRLSNCHPRLVAPGPVQLQSPHCVPAARGAAGLGRMAWERGMRIGAGGWSPSLLLGRGSGNPKKFRKASGSLLGGSSRKVSCSSGTALGTGGACKKSCSACNDMLGFGASWSIILSSGLAWGRSPALGLQDGSAPYRLVAAALELGPGGVTAKPLLAKQCLSRPAAYAQINTHTCK